MPKTLWVPTGSVEIRLHIKTKLMLHLTASQCVLTYRLYSIIFVIDKIMSAIILFKSKVNRLLNYDTNIIQYTFQRNYKI